MSLWQKWLVDSLYRTEPISTFMNTRWGWPIVESVHFIGLTLLFGCIATWDLRLIGVARHVPISAFHRLVPFAVGGFVLNALTGSMFLLTVPNQYIYNPAFQFKFLLIGLAGLNVLVFYGTVFRRMRTVDSNARAPETAKFFGAASLVFWIGVIICGRLITFYRPAACNPGQPVGFIADCVMR